MTTKLPSIPAFNGENTAEVLTALTEATQVRVGVRGDSLDAGVTFRDLAGIGLVQETSSNASVIQGLSASVNLKLPDGRSARSMTARLISPLHQPRPNSKLWRSSTR